MPLQVPKECRSCHVWRFLTCTLGSLVGAILLSGPAWAQVIPESTVVVVNSESWVSRWVANEYQQLRGIPDSNIVQLAGLPSFERLGVEQFRDHILRPVLKALDDRGIRQQIHALVYSADMPTTIDVRADVGERKLGQIFTLDAAINGLTYTYSLVLEKDPRYLNLDVNQYAQRLLAVNADGTVQMSTPHGFRADRGWTSGGEMTENAAAPRYLASTVLAVTAGRGLSVREALEQLRRSARADFVPPRGTIYFPKNGDVRSKTREWAFETATRQLQQAGIAAEVTSGALPPAAVDVAGAVIGIADFNWTQNNARIQPGAIVEHLTSFGGVLTAGAGQTPLTEFLRHGAAGASGTVTEPYAIQAKFPTPFIQVGYTQGLSLVESFYQSVSGPYQLLIVGDALCRPWAEKIDVQVTGWPADAVLRGDLELPVAAHNQAGEQAVEYRLYVDGRWHSNVLVPESPTSSTAGAGAVPGAGASAKAETDANGSQPRARAELRCDTTKLTDGEHRFAIVAVGKGPISFLGKVERTVTVANNPVEFSIAAPAAGDLANELPFEIEANCPGAQEIIIRHQGRDLVRIGGAAGKLTIDPRLVGPGPILLQPVARMGDREIRGKRLHWNLPLASYHASLPAEQPAAGSNPPASERPASARPGSVRLRVGEQPWTTVAETRGDWLAKAGVQADQPLTIEWDLRSDAAEVYQLQWNGRLSVEEILVNDKRVEWPATGEWRYVPVPLAAGNHRVTLRCRGVANPTLELRWGNRGTTWLKSAATGS